jgi:hypothetical protein
MLGDGFSRNYSINSVADESIATIEGRNQLRLLQKKNTIKQLKI